MTFHSAAFFVFTAGVLVAFNLVAPRLRVVTLLVASYAFCISQYAPNALILLGITAVAYVAGHTVAEYKGRGVLILAVFLVAVPLLSLKYGGLISSLIDGPSMAASTGAQHWLMPTGISFFTFQAISHVVDAYRGHTLPAPPPGTFTMYLAFFPTVLAGPIARSRNLLPQLLLLRPTRAANAYTGGRMILWGLFCKRVVADNLSTIVDGVVAEPNAHSGSSLAVVFALFSFQIYFDFLGYSSIAIGLARCFNLRLPRNFRRPYAAQSLREFWHRWHITLSTWFRDYLYIPLGGSRVPEPRRSFQMIAVFMLSGLWHGAALNFVAWGAVHGMGYVVEDGVRRYRRRNGRPHRVWALRRFVRMGITFSVVTLGWIFFRMPSLRESFSVLRRIFYIEEGVPYLTLSPVLYRPDTVWFLCLLLAALSIDAAARFRRGLNRVPVTRRQTVAELATVNLLAVTTVLFGDLARRDFFYFRF